MRTTVHAQVIRRYPAPAFPTRPDVAQCPALLAERLPDGWRRAEIAAAVGSFLAVTAGCRESPGGAKPIGTESQAAAVVAPIFQHGEGRGAFGCVVVASPAYLSEEEAWLIVKEVLESHGVTSLERDVTLSDVQVRTRKSTVAENWVTGVSRRVLTDELRPLEADVRDPQRRVVVEFISLQDQAVLGEPEEFTSTVGSIDLQATAARVAKSVGKEGRDVYFGALYDPLVLTRYDWGSSDSNASTSYEESRKKAADEARELLRAQVLDFVQWLEAQGAI